MLVVLPRPVNDEVSVTLETLQEPRLHDVPGHAPQEHARGVGGVLVATRGQLSTPRAHHFCKGGEGTNRLDD